MIIKLKKDLCVDEATEFVWCAKRSMYVRFLKRVTHDEFVICVWNKNDSQSWDESKQIFDVNKKSSRRISKSFSNRANMNHKESNVWSVCNIARKIVEWRDDWSEEIRKILESQDRESIVLIWSKALIQRMLLFDRRTSFDWMKIEQRNDEKNRKNFWNEFSNQNDSEMSSQKRQKTIEKSHRKEEWLEQWIDEKEIFQIWWNDAKCLVRRDICERASLIQIDQLLNVKQRHRHSRLQRFRSILTKSNNWFERSVSNR
jgi:hypothetical protein